MECEVCIFLLLLKKKLCFKEMYELSLSTSYPKTKYEKIENLITNMSVIIPIN